MMRNKLSLNVYYDEDNGECMVIQNKEKKLNSDNKNIGGNILGHITNTQQMDDIPQ